MDQQLAKDSLFRVISAGVIIAVVLAVYAMFWGPWARYSSSLMAARTLSVSASDKVTAKPDIATLSFSVVTEGASVTSVIEDNNKKMNAAILFVKEQGVDEKDIKTTGYQLSPIYTQPQQLGYGEFVPRIARYSLTQTVTVKIRDFTKTSSLLDKLPTLGINQIGTISFGIDDPETYLAQAREGAFAKAREKAERIAKQNGLSLGRVMNVSDYSQENYPMFSSLDARGGYGGGAVMKAAPSIEPGSQEVSVNVNVMYEIR